MVDGDIELVGYSAPQKRVPDFFIVGHPKCGTTALYEMLKRHPEIYMPDLKEPWFLASELRFRDLPRAPRGIPQNLDEYLSLFSAAEPGQRVGEASPLYLWSQTAAARIADLQPDAYIIAILREPASFLSSLHLQYLQTHIETEKDLRKAIALEDERRQGRHIPSSSYWPQVLIYSDYVRYVDQLRRYHEVFAPRRVLVLIYDDFRRDNEGSVQKVLRFLNVDEARPVETVSANPTVRVRSQILDDLTRKVYMGAGPISRVVKGGIKTLVPRQVRRGALETTQHRILHSDPRPADEGLMLELRRSFASEVAAVSEYLNRDLVTLWGYDRLG